MKPFFVHLLVVVVLSLASCKGISTPLTDLNGSSWILTHISSMPVLDGTHPTLSLRDGQASGNGSCNSFGGEYILKGERLTFGPLMSTLMACDPVEVMEQEQAFLSALGSATQYNIKDDQLNIINADGNVVLTFSSP